MLEQQIFVGMFPLGVVVVTPGCLKVTSEEERFRALTRHMAGDWGDVSENDRVCNEEALRSGDQILSVYYTPDGVKFWIITEWDRSVTTVLLPEDY